MFRMYASYSHSYTHLILALGIVREPTVWGFLTSNYPGIECHDLACLLLPSRLARTLMRLVAVGNRSGVVSFASGT